VKLSLVRRVRLAGQTIIAGFGLTMEAFGLVLVFDWLGVSWKQSSWGQGQL
jgi:hypothetical protein